MGDPQTWTWNEPDGVVQVGSGEGAAKDIQAAKNALNYSVEEQNNWEELLRARYEDFVASHYVKCSAVNLGVLHVSIRFYKWMQSLHC